MFNAPTTCLNLMRLLRALQVASRAVLLEGSPGVGKTSLVLALAEATGNKVTRINLSEQTDVSDLFGTDLPVEGAAGGTFAWSDGPFLRALKEGHWILLDELNLASQSVIEGLNSVLDHRGEIFIPDLGKTFKVNPEQTKLFGCQNPQRQGGARKGLPQSFLNRFTQVFVEPLTELDLEVIINGLFPDVKSDLLKKMVDFHNKISLEKWSSPGLWEFNLRDLMRWGESLSQVVPGASVETIYAARMPSKKDKDLILGRYKEVFGASCPLACSLSPILVSPTKLTIGEVSLPREHARNPYETCNTKDTLLILREQQPPLKSLTLCVKMGWMAILVGKSGSGKTSLVHILAQLAGKKLNTIPVSSAMDTTDLLGGFEQTDLWRHLERAGREGEELLNQEAGRHLLAGEVSEAAELSSLLYQYRRASGQSQKGYDLKTSEANFRNASERLSRILDALPSSPEQKKLKKKLQDLDSLLTSSGLQAGGVFEWVDSLLIKCVEEGEWLLLENVNLCSGAVLDRLNSLLEKNGSLALGERGSADENILPHPDFRIFLTMDPKHGTISRAMRNRGVEIYLDVPEAKTMHPFDLDSMLYSSGLLLDIHRQSLKEIHFKITDKNIGPEPPGVHHLLEVAYISCQNWKQGFSLFDSVDRATLDVYVKSRTLSFEQRKSLKIALKEILTEHKASLNDSYFCTVDCFWPLYKTLSTLSIQEESHLAIVKQHSSVIYSILRNFERSKFSHNWPKDFTLKSIIGSELSSYPCDGLKYLNLSYDVLTVIPYILMSYYCCSNSMDILVKKKLFRITISQILRYHPYPDLLMTMFDVVQHISNIIYETLSPWKAFFQERPWDMRHITNVNDPSKCNSFFSRENNIFTHICFKILQAPFLADEGRGKTKLKIMSAIEYSKAVEIGNVDKWPYREPLILELYPLLSTFDDLLSSALNSDQVLLPNDKCADLIYRLAWRFKLSTVAKRRLFKVERAMGAPLAVCPDTIGLLKLHYSWFKKHSVSALMDLTQGSSVLSVKVHDFQEILNSIDSCLDDGSAVMIPVARKFRKQYTIPLPKSSTLQCSLAKKILSLESEIDIWRNSSKLVKKINFIASEDGVEARVKLTSSFLQLLENKDLEILNSQVPLIETSFKKLSEIENASCNLNDIIRLKIWPVMELLGLQLSTAVRGMLSTEKSTFSELDKAVIEGFLVWVNSTSSLPPSVGAALQAGLSTQSELSQSLTNRVELSYFLMDHPNISPPLIYPRALIRWEQAQEAAAAQGGDGFLITDEKGVYMSHMPLVSLFLSELMVGFSSQQDTPSFALKSHKNLTKMFHILRLLLWRNLPAIFSSELCNKTNEIVSIRNTFNNLLYCLKKAFNRYKSNTIQETSPAEITREILGVLEKLVGSKECIRSGGGADKVQPEKGLFGSLSALEQLIPRLEGSGGRREDTWRGIGEAWLNIGRVHLLLFSLLEPVDPVKKDALKKQYVSEEISELKVLLCVEELNKLLIGAPLSWPLKEEHEKRINLLESKISSKNQATSIRPTISLYENILMDVIYLTTVLVSDETFTSRLSSLTSLKGKNRDEIELHLSEVKSWLTSLSGISEKLFTKYYNEYPDIISPILMAMSQLNYGLKLVWTSANKEILQKHQSRISILEHLKVLSSFPVCGVKSSFQILETCCSNEIVNLLNKSTDESTKFSEQENKIKLIKVCIKLIKSISQSRVMKEGAYSLFQVLDHVVLCWHQIQEQEKIKKAQEDSIYINKMKLTEEELLEREKQTLFPTWREEDFYDIDGPETLEGYGEVPEKKEREDTLKLSREEIAEICDLHGQIVREACSAHWLPDTVPKEFSHIDLLRDRMDVFSTLISQHYQAVDGEPLEKYSLPSLLLVAGLPASQVELPESAPGKHYNFYRDSNISESKTCIPLLNAILKRIKELLSEWPDHPTLNQAVVIIDRVLGFSMGSPLSRFLTGLELLLTKLHQWEENAHSGVSLAQHQASLTQQIISWRKLELSAWKGALNSASIRIEDNCRKYWFHIYSLVTSFTRGCEKEAEEEEIEELVKSLEGFMEGSSLGEFSARLRLIFTFHCHALLLPVSSRRDIVISVLWNLFNFYNHFSNSVAKTIEDLTSVLKDKVKKFVQIARWNDINYWSVKSAIDKTHHTLLKHIKDFERILNEPARGAMTKMEVHKDLPKMNLTGLKVSNYLTSSIYPDSHKDHELKMEDSLFYRLNSLFKKSKNLSTKIYQNCDYPKLLDNFELLVDDIEETGKLLNELDIDPATPKEKKKSAFKALLQKKRKAISDLFKLLAQIGLSYRSGVILFEQKNISFAKMPPFDIGAGLDVLDKWKSDREWRNSWKGADSYFHTTTAKLAMLKIAIEKPHQDLGPQTTERIKGYSCHSNSFLLSLRESLYTTTLTVYRLRCQINQFKKLNDTDVGLINSKFELNKDKLKNTYEDVIFIMKQFVVLIDACPEQDVKISDNQPVPVIFSEAGKHSMIMAFKNDTIWESTRAKIDEIINVTSMKLKQIISHEKHSLYIKKVNPDMNADVIIDKRMYDSVEGGYDYLRKIYSKVSELENNFQLTFNGRTLFSPLTISLENLKSIIDTTLESHYDINYPTGDLLGDILGCIEKVSSLPVKVKLENFLNKILLIIQNIYKNHVLEEETGTVCDAVVSENETPDPKDTIVDGHLKEKIIGRLTNELKELKMSEISDDIQNILFEITSISNDVEKRICQRVLFHIFPLLDQLLSIYQYFMVQLTASVKVLGKFSAYLMSVLIEFSKNGYRIPEEMMEGDEEGEGESQTKGGLGLGEGEGEKDVSEQIESEDQLEDARRPGDYGQDEEKDCKEEEKGIEMSDNFDGKLQDLEKKDNDEQQSGDESDKEEDLDKEMGETEKGAETLDKQIWGSDSEDEPEDEEAPKEEEGDRGEQQTEKELGAGDDEKDQVGDKEDRRKKEPKEKEINEMDDQEVDDDQIDPYHGKQQPSPEIEPLELEDDDLNIDEDEKMSEGEDEENPFDIDTMKKSIDDKEGEEPENEEKPDEGEKDEDGQGSDKGDDDLPKPEIKGPEKEEDEPDEPEEGDKDNNEKGEEVEQEMEEEAGHLETEGADEQPTQQDTEKSEKPHGSKDQVRKNEDGEEIEDVAPEESKAEGKEESGSGKAEKMEIDKGGHRGDAGAQKNQGLKEREEKRQRPGQSEMERSLGESNEPVKKKLKTMSVGEGKDDKEEEEKKGEEKMEEDTQADIYQHIREAKESSHDTQTVDAATKEQAEKQPPTIGTEDEDKEELKEDEEINVLDEDDIDVEVKEAAQLEKSKLDEGERRPDSPTKQKGEGGGPLEEAKVEVEGEFVDTATVMRGTESSYHTRLSEISTQPLTEAELISMRQQLEEQLASWNQAPERSEAMAAWEKVCSLTQSLAQQLSEELRLVLEPTTTSSLRGDFRTGKRINMRKVIPYIASQFRKDKIWLRRTKPSKREYQIILAIDDSSSMADNHSKELAFESLAMVSKALNLIEAGELGVLSFGEEVRVLHQLGQPFTESSGARLMQEFTFDEKRTRVGAAVETALSLISHRGADSAQLLVIISDGRCVMSEGEQTIRSAVRKASHARLFIVFLIIDSPNSKDSVLDIRMATFNAAKKLEMKSYIDNFPFPFYLILRDISNLPTVLSDALRQWFELVTDIQ